MRMRRMPSLTPAMMLRAYAAGLFPMADGADSSRLRWYDPDPRGIMPLDAFHLPRRLRRTVLGSRFTVTADRAFEEVMRACAAPAPGRESTWINEDIVRVFCALHEAGCAHSIEAWREGVLAGGLYGVSIGRAFFGESMFSRATDASKTALVHLVARLRLRGFALLDTQFGTEHLARFGGIEIPANDYKKRLEPAVAASPCWEQFDDLDPGLVDDEIRTMGDRPDARSMPC
ncbi:leucyl/phenylalanyl-tRNA--protein transferase [Acetobacter nitrogenifigens DSM 23921 = NBRC 105050]|uniref:Leucyl/phenylalanyl-tRNA--protein transferase n=3 Tax=Acetobacter nitrogenifigens TaxID=285268 RepID=A0A511X6W9_9PROT|nr:leucyl/phenylalanyl-tRNA--protein transferase [Acetobacter nitrogenifigens]GEN58690.1 leucyl/phenylalanyl-tRNA--protein transferase [Acetobacter nitrogenifigens DSM 23921 = NBRC 105050]